jgi:hypothetical protein
MFGIVERLAGFIKLCNSENCKGRYMVGDALPSIRGASNEGNILSPMF